MKPMSILLLVAGAGLGAGPLLAQDSYEIQVYGSETMPMGTTMFELHSNYTVNGRSSWVNGVQPSQHALHETVEITHGFTRWFEIGFYTFTSYRSPDGWQWVGNTIRPRVRVPPEWRWPVGVSLSQEIGYNRRAFSEATWGWEIRPILDRDFGKFYVSLNPTFEVALVGDSVSHTPEFTPNAMITFAAADAVILGLEYYGALGPVTDFAPASAQEHQIFPALNLNLLPQLELNVAVGWGVTSVTDRWLVKVITGYRIGP